MAKRTGVKMKATARRVQGSERLRMQPSRVIAGNGGVHLAGRERSESEDIPWRQHWVARLLIAGKRSVHHADAPDAEDGG